MRVNLFFLLTVLFCALHSNAQQIDSTQLFLDAQILSADSLEGRRTGTEGNEKARKYILNRLREMGVAAYFPDYTQKFTYNLRNKKEETGQNIVGYIEGDSVLSIVISAHYDHVGKKDTLIFNGADDNASGVAALLAMAKYYSENKPQHTIIFAFFDAEEQGLKGAKAFVSSSSFDNKNVALNVNMDMISRSENEIYLSGIFHYPFLEKHLPKAPAELSVKLGHDNPKEKKDDWTFASDHAPFHQAKIPFIYFGVEDHPDYHQPSDTFEKVNKPFFHRSSQYILETVRSFDEGLELIKEMTQQEIMK